MIQHIHERLVRWADWAATGGGAAGLGYPSSTLKPRRVSAVCVFAMDPMSGGDLEAEETERAVVRLDDASGLVVRAYYLGRGSVRQKARDCGVSVDTLYRRLEEAQRAVDAGIQEARAAWPVRSVFAPSVRKVNPVVDSIGTI